MLYGLLESARSWVKRRRFEEDLDEELLFHLEMESQRNVQLGMTPRQARFEARKSFGFLSQVKEDVRETRGLDIADSLWQDLRYGFRNIAKRPGFAALIITTLALGIGANTAIFSVIHGVLIRPLPYEDGERLVALRQQAPRANFDNLAFSVQEVNDYRQRNKTLDRVVEYHSMPFILLGHGEPERVQTGVVSWDFFDVFKIEPVMGRTFRVEEQSLDAEPVLILSYEYWRDRRGGDPDIVGKRFEMNDRAHEVIGVLPSLPRFPNRDDIYMTTSACPFRTAESMLTNRRARMMSVFGRRRQGVSLEEVQEDIDSIAGALREQYPEAYPDKEGYGARVTALGDELTSWGFR